MLQEKHTAPAFNARNQDSQVVSLADYAGKKTVVLYFYPKDDTPGCTIEANQFTELASEFAANDTVVIGVSKDACDSHLAFIDKYDLKLDLLADTDGDICQKYNVWQEKEKNGVKKMGIVRSTFVINKQGLLEMAAYNVKPDGHAQDVLNLVKQL